MERYVCLILITKETLTSNSSSDPVAFSERKLKCQKGYSGLIIFQWLFTRVRTYYEMFERLLKLLFGHICMAFATFESGRAWNRELQLSLLNEEFPVSVSHQLVLIMSLPFVHTARCYYRLNGLVRSSDCAGIGLHRWLSPFEKWQMLTKLDRLKEVNVVTRFPWVNLGKDH